MTRYFVNVSIGSAANKGTHPYGSPRDAAMAIYHVVASSLGEPLLTVEEIEEQCSYQHGRHVFSIEERRLVH